MYGDGSRQWRNPDLMGNVYDSPDRTDRNYGRGGQLREDRKWRYYYDSHGNLVLKTMRRMEPSHNAEAQDEFLAWQSSDYAYMWQGNGMLRSVTRPDGKTVTFRYDALGRRIEKVFDGRVYRYLWDGDVILHEWDYAEADRPNTVVTETGEVTLDRPEPVENLITWVYDSDSYVPTAKIVGDRHYSIISDYIGRPVQAYDDKGNVVWQADYDIYGNLRNLHGSRRFIPFRQLGQYEDEETGQYYNRFRYYDPNTGTYISQDPIGLAGNNPTLYGYVGDCNKWFDLFGLDYFYQLIRHDKVVYNGITKNLVKDRIADHIGVKDFTEFRYVQVKDRIASRNLEGSALHHADGKGLRNTHRKDGQYYHSYDPDNLAVGRTYYTQTEIDEIMKKAETGEIKDGKVILHNCK